MTPYLNVRSGYVHTCLKIEFWVMLARLVWRNFAEFVAVGWRNRSTREKRIQIRSVIRFESRPCQNLLSHCPLACFSWISSAVYFWELVICGWFYNDWLLTLKQNIFENEEFFLRWLVSLNEQKYVYGKIPYNWLERLFWVFLFAHKILIF